MELSILTLIVAVVALIGGIVAGKMIFAKDNRKIIEEGELAAQTLMKEAQLRAETLKKEKELEVKEKFVQLKADHDREVLERNRKIGESENRIKQKELVLSQKTEGLHHRGNNVLHFHFIVMSANGIDNGRILAVFFSQLGAQQGMAQFGFFIRNLANIVKQTGPFSQLYI